MGVDGLDQAEVATGAERLREGRSRRASEGLRRKEGFLRADWSLGARWMDGCGAGDTVLEEGGGKLTGTSSRQR